MKMISLILTTLLLSFSFSAAHASPAASSQFCSDFMSNGGGVDGWPWSVARPFPWDNIEGYWKLSGDGTSYIKAHVLSSSSTRKILSLIAYGDGLCSKPYARGTGYVDVSEKNVVRALVSDGSYKYQLKLGLFNSMDVFSDSIGGSCGKNIMAISMQIIATDTGEPVQSVDSDMTEAHNMMLKKVTVNPNTMCK